MAGPTVIKLSGNAGTWRLAPRPSWRTGLPKHEHAGARCVGAGISWPLCL